MENQLKCLACDPIWTMLLERPGVQTAARRDHARTYPVSAYLLHLYMQIRTLC